MNIHPAIRRLLVSWMLLSAALLPQVAYSMGPSEFALDLARVQNELADPARFNPASCSRYLEENTAFLIRHGADTYLPRSEREAEQLATHVPAILEDMFQLRLLVSDRLKGFHQEGLVSQGCLTGIRRTLRYARFIEEFLAEWYLAKSGVPVPEIPFTGDSPANFLNPRYPALEFRSGDVILMRSNNFIGATIARIGDEDGQFSHAALVYRERPDTEPLVMEATVGHGTIIDSLSAFLHKSPARIALFRHQNPDYAARAAEAMYRHIRTEEARRGFIPYDFKLDITRDDRFFCTELVGRAYRWGSQERVRLPTFPTSMRVFAQHPFLAHMDIAAGETFAPSDIEIEPQFTLVAEWRDPRLTGQARRQDAILSSILEWMAQRQYRLSFHILNRVGTAIAWAMMKPASLFLDRVPTNMHRPFLSTVMLIRSITIALEWELARELGDLEDATTTVDYASIMSALETIRRRDCARDRAYTTWRTEWPLHPEQDGAPPSPRFHHLINVPDESGGCMGDR